MLHKCCLQVGIITKLTRADVANAREVPIDEVPEDDEEIEAIVVTGSEIRTMDEERWAFVLDHQEIVFARTTPQQKLDIVRRCQVRFFNQRHSEPRRDYTQANPLHTLVELLKH